MAIAYHAVAQRARLTETRAPAPFIIKDKKSKEQRETGQQQSDDFKTFQYTAKENIFLFIF